MLGAQQEGDVLEGLAGEDRQGLGADAQDILAGELLDDHVFLRLGDLVVLGAVLGEGEGLLVEERGCGHNLLSFAWEGDGVAGSAGKDVQL